MNQDSDIQGLAYDQALPCYCLVEGDKPRLRGGGHDMYVVVHASATVDGEILVGVIRRRLSLGVDGERTATPTHLVREGVAMELAIASGVADLAKVHELGCELAGRDEAWKPTTIKIDGRPAAAHECEYADTWAVEYIDPDIAVFAVGPIALRPDVVALERVSLDELQNED